MCLVSATSRDGRRRVTCSSSRLKQSPVASISLDHRFRMEQPCRYVHVTASGWFPLFSSYVWYGGRYWPMKTMTSFEITSQWMHSSKCLLNQQPVKLRNSLAYTCCYMCVGLMRQETSQSLYTVILSHGRNELERNRILIHKVQGLDSRKDLVLEMNLSAEVLIH